MEWVSLHTAGTRGSEGGVILRDAEYAQSCRITLERCEQYDAVTCGIYGAMAHTAFADPANSLQMYLAMQQELQAFLERDTSPDEELAFYEQFCMKY